MIDILERLLDYKRHPVDGNQKSSTSWGNGSWNPIICKVLAPFQVVICLIPSINSSISTIFNLISSSGRSRSQLVTDTIFMVEMLVKSLTAENQTADPVRSQFGIPIPVLFPYIYTILISKPGSGIYGKSIMSSLWR